MMATNSYPAVGTGGLTDAQWAAMYGAIDGIVEDYDGNAGALSRLNTSNICRVQPVKVKINGYVLDVTAAHDLYCAPVASGQPDKTYYIAAQYDPALNVAQGPGDTNPGQRSVDGPCHLLITTGSPDTSGGKAYTLLYKITRSANQLLADAELTDLRRWVGEAYEMPVYLGFAPPRGSVVYQSDIAEWSVRTLIDGVIGWKSISRGNVAPIPVPGALVAYDRPATYQLTNGRIYLEGNLRRSSGTPLITAASPDVILGTLPVGARPGGNVRFPVEVLGTYEIATVRIGSNGVITLIANFSADAVDLAGISFRQEN